MSYINTIVHNILGMLIQSFFINHLIEITHK